MNTSRNVRKVLLPLVALVWVQVACGGGGGGGVAPTQPPPPDGGGDSGQTDPGPPGGNVRGNVIGFMSAGTSFTGSQVQAGNGAATTINTNNRFSLSLPTGATTLTISGSNHVTRRVRVQVDPGGINNFDDISIIENSFNNEAYDDIYREDGDGTYRWKRAPRVILDRASLEDLPQGWDFFRTEIIDRNLRNKFPSLMQGVWNNLDIDIERLDPLPDTSPCLETDNYTLVFRGVDDCNRDGGNVTLGVASHCVFAQGFEAVTSVVTFNPCTDAGTITHEIQHTMCAAHLDLAGGQSIMTPFRNPAVNDLTSMDRRHIRLLYTRPAGTRSPDDTSQRMTLMSRLTSEDSQQLLRPGPTVVLEPDSGPARVFEDHH